MPSMMIVAYAMALMFSPEALTLLGNTLGQSNLALVVSGLVLAGGLHGLTVWMYGKFGYTVPTDSGEAQFFLHTWGPVIATVLPLCARITYTVCASTGILAIAGYVFNEVFVYWFPNLGFSFALLGSIVLLNLLHPKIATSAQLFAMLGALGGLLWLSGAVLGGFGPQVAPVFAVTEPPTFGIGRSFLTGLVLLMGFELALFAPGPASGNLRGPVKLMLLALVLASVLFGLWSWASLSAVAPARLAQSTVPHMVTARAILGEHGRLLMGLVVLAGTFGAVHALLGGGARLLAGMAQQGLLPGWLSVSQTRPALLLLASGPALMMGLGMAGEPATEVYTRAGILFWMLLYAVGHLTVLVRPRSGDDQPGVTPGSGTTLLSGLSLCLLSGSMLGLLWYEPVPRHLLLFMGSVGLVTTCLSAFWRGYCRLQRRERTPDITMSHHATPGADTQSKGNRQ